MQAKPEETIALGSGRSFAVSCGKVCDRGFRVAFNATLRGATGAVLNSFTNTVDVPGSKIAEDAACSWQGDWQTEWTAGGAGTYAGTVTFRTNGTEVVGKYDYGTVTLAGSESILAGRWTHTAVLPGIPCSSGPVTFKKEGCSFEGAWNFCSDAPKYWWRGKKLR